MNSSPRVTVGIPVFRGENLVADALASLQAQTLEDFKAIVSVDGGDETSAAVCRSFESDPRFRVAVQSDLLGWPDNLNWLMRVADGEFFLFLGQDDQLAPDCLAALVAHADRHPDATIAYPDMRWLGEQDSIQAEPQIDGGTVERLLAQLERCIWLPHHGLQRIEVVRATGPLIGGDFAGVFSDVVWVTKAMRHGPMHRVASPLYVKRRHTGSVTALQSRWPPEQIRDAWFDVWIQMLAATLPAMPTPDDARRALLIVLSRVAAAAPNLGWFFDLSRLDRDTRRQLLIRFLHLIRDRQIVDLTAIFGEDWDGILRLTVRETGLEPGLLGSLRREYRRFRRRGISRPSPRAPSANPPHP